MIGLVFLCPRNFETVAFRVVNSDKHSLKHLLTLNRLMEKSHVNESTYIHQTDNQAIELGAKSCPHHPTLSLTSHTSPVATGRSRNITVSMFF